MAITPSPMPQASHARCGGVAHRPQTNEIPLVYVISVHKRKGFCRIITGRLATQADSRTRERGAWESLAEGVLD